MPDRTSAHLQTIAEMLGVPSEAFGTGSAPHLLHTNEAGARWLLAQDAQGNLVVRYADGQRIADEDVFAFLARDPGSPQHGALAALIGRALVTHIAGPSMNGSRSAEPEPHAK